MYMILHTCLSHYIFVDCFFFSLLLAIIILLRQINVHNNVPPTGFSVVCTLPVFIIYDKNKPNLFQFSTSEDWRHHSESQLP